MVESQCLLVPVFPWSAAPLSFVHGSFSDASGFPAQCDSCVYCAVALPPIDCVCVCGEEGAAGPCVHVCVSVT